MYTVYLTFIKKRFVILILMLLCKYFNVNYKISLNNIIIYCHKSLGIPMRYAYVVTCKTNMGLIVYTSCCLNSEHWTVYTI